MSSSCYTIPMPEWLSSELEKSPTVYPTLEERMRLVIKFSQHNIDQKTGGPFAAVVFEEEPGKLVSIGVNRVMPLNCSSLHAEIVALTLAARVRGQGQPKHQLLVNWRPCVMCYGAVIWSGIKSLVIADSGTELEDITGFDEGPMNSDWKRELNMRGINLVDGLLTSEAVKVFQSFKSRNMHVYNSREG